MYIIWNETKITFSKGTRPLPNCKLISTVIKILKVLAQYPRAGVR